ncbi:MAG: hypothetical protein P1S60_01775 [Anaerolineae bacterium]|nr:hypothetical protein [Anaerolineae bacterium]
MPVQGPLSWLDGEGWLVLAGGGDPETGVTDQVDMQLLSIANLDRPMVVLLSDGNRIQAEILLDHYTGLGGPGGEAFSLTEMTRTQLHTPRFLSLLSEAGVLCLGGVNPIPLVQNLYNSPALQHIIQGYSSLQAMSILGLDAGAAALAQWTFGPAPDYLQAMGLGWLSNSVIVPNFTRTEDSAILRQLPQVAPDVLGLGIPVGTALALGPIGQVETWGSGQVTAVINAGTS